MIGDVVAGRYKLQETLGNGAMGQVFIAESLSIGRRVAIKMLKAELLADASFRKRFQQEAQAIAAIEHRNVARFFDLVVGDPTFLVMEFVPGPTLAQVLKSGRLELARAVNIARRLGWALDAAHRAGVIHRDIKPSNVILTPDPESGEDPKLIDFGLAKLASATEGEALTRTGQIVGTPQYMSPEQIANKDVDGRSDVYSLGCVLYEMLTGAAPFSGRDDVQILYQQVHTKAPRLRERVPELPQELDSLVARCLAKSPGERFASMLELTQALRAVDRRHRERAAGGETGEGSSGTRVGVGWAMALGVAAAIAGGGGVWLGMHDRGGGALLVTSRPSGAIVEVDGRRWRETTPTAVTALPPGRHEVVVTAPGHERAEQVVTIEGAGRASVDVALAPKQRTLEVQTIPGGAQVFVDGHLAFGRTPLTLTLSADDFHELRLELAGYEIKSYAIKPEDHEPALTLNLEAALHDRGTVWIDGPTTAEVFIDGAPTGSWAPTIGLQVTTGSHLVELRGDDGKVLAQEAITLKRGAVLHIAPTLVPTTTSGR